MCKTKSNEGVLALDLGTSSVRAVVYDTHGQMVAPTLCDLPYKVRTTYPGEVSSDPDELVRLIASSIDAALKAARKERVDIVGAAAACYWHSLMGVDRNERPTTELRTWADTRSASETRNLRPTFAKRWPQLRDIPWFLLLGDGALANVDAGCVDPRWLCATIGTSSALRVILDRNHLTVPWGAFVYRLDKKRFVLGGALSEG